MKKMVAEKGLDSQYEIASAATSTEEIGNDIYPPAKECLKRHGVPYSRRAARQMTREDYDYYDRIFVMDQNNMRYLRWDIPDIIAEAGHGRYYDPNAKIQLLMELTGSTRDVADPWYTGNFEQTYNDLVQAINYLLP